MSKVLEKGLIVRKDNVFTKIRDSIYRFLFPDEYYFDVDYKKLFSVHRVNPSKIIIPREIGVGKNE